jgi:hypothetical protein
MTVVSKSFWSFRRAHRDESRPDNTVPRSDSERRLLLRLYYGGFAVAIFAVALQMGGVRGGFLTNYLADIAGPIWLYGALRLRATLLNRIYKPTPSPVFTALFVFLVGTVWEICQAFDLSGTILAACVAVDGYVRMRSQTATVGHEPVPAVRENRMP